MKPAAHLLPWDTLTWSDDPSLTVNVLVRATKSWWLRRRGELPCILPREMILHAAEVMAFGIVQHPEQGGRSWEIDERYMAASYHFASIMRHALATPDIDRESGLPHEWHVATRYMMLTALMARGRLIDDRPKAQGVAGDLEDVNELAFVPGSDDAN